MRMQNELRRAPIGINRAGKAVEHFPAESQINQLYCAVSFRRREWTAAAQIKINVSANRQRLSLKERKLRERDTRSNHLKLDRAFFRPVQQIPSNVPCVAVELRIREPNLVMTQIQHRARAI